MSEFRTIREAVLRNSLGCELDRISLRKSPAGFGHDCLPALWSTIELELGDTITIEERETEIV